MSYRIVVADKDPRSREAVTRFLLSENNEFVSVSNSGELKQAIKSQKPDLIIMNAVLADAPGWKLVQRIKDSREYSDVPVLLMTGDPGSPPAAQIQAAGADKYVTKPLDGRALKEAVQSLLGTGSATEDAALSEEIMIDFADEDSGDMTEELLQMSNVALGSDEPPTDVGDTVEIDTGTLVAELDHRDELTGEDTYEDTVRLNLEDMGLDDELDGGSSFEPTIELISDIPADAPEDDLLGALELEHKPQEHLPDFSAVTGRVRDADSQGKDSVTVDMDAEDMGLELDFDEFEDDSASMQDETIDVDDTEIGQILEVQEPSQVLTSDDLLLEADSVVKDGVTGTSTTGVEVIDLEEDAELKEIDLEELEPVQEEMGPDLGLDLDASFPLEEEMELTAVEPLEGGIADDEDVSLDLELPLDLTSGYDAHEELTLEEGDEEELTTQEFFGEELPTEEFPTEKFPSDKTADLRLEDEIVLDDIDFKSQYSPEPGHVSAEVPMDDIAMDAESTEEMLFRQAPEDEPVLEVTEDIAFDEILLPDIVEAASSEEKAATGEPPAALPREQPLPQVPMPGAPLAALDVPPSPAPTMAAVTEPAAPEPAKAETLKPPAAPPSPPPQPVQAAAAAGVSPHEIASIISTSLGSLLHQTMPGKSQLADTVDTAVKGSLPTKHELSDAYSQTLQANLPTKEEILHALTKEMASMMPTREAVSARVDEMVAGAIPSADVLAEKVDHAIKGALPSSEAILERLTHAVKVMPWTQDVTTQLEKALTALPSSEAIHARLTEALERIPPQEEIRSRIDKALEALPNAEAVREHLDKAFHDFPTREQIEAKVDATLAGLSADQVMLRVDGALKDLPTREEIEAKVDASLAGLSADQVMLRVDGALKDLPTREEIEARVDASLAGLSADQVMSRVETALSALPTQEVVMERLDRSLSVLPSAASILSRVEDRLAASMPDRETVSTAMQEMFSAKISGAFSETEVRDTLLGILPSTDEILETMQSALPEKERLQEAITQSLTVAIENSLPERVWLETVSRGLFDERTRGSLPKKDEIVSMLRQEIRGKLLDAVEKAVREQIERITAELSA